MKRVVSIGLGALALFVVTSSRVDTADVAGAPANVPTFAKDVAPIVFNHCAQCHRPGEVAPMSLLSYNDVRPWARAIKSKVVSRAMPPWGADPSQSLKMTRRSSVPQLQSDTTVAWADGGAPRGNDVDLPPAPTFATGWMHGSEPDFIMEMP